MEHLQKILGDDKVTIQFLKYFSGKNRLAKRIISLIPAHYCYIEPFGGSASVLLNKRPSPIEVWNDIYKDLVNLFVCVQRNPERLKKIVQKIPYSRFLFGEFIKELTEKEASIGDFNRAAKFFFIQTVSFAGRTPERTSKRQFRINRRPTGGRNPAIEFYRKAELIDAVGYRLRNVIIEDLDAIECIQKYDAPQTVFYVDPPYFKSSNECGIVEFPEEKHKELQRVLKATRGKWILTYDNCKEIRQLYKGFTIQYVDLPMIAPNSEQTQRIRQFRVEHLIIRNFK